MPSDKGIAQDGGDRIERNSALCALMRGGRMDARVSEPSGGVVTLTVTGEIDFGSARELRDAAERARASCPDRLFVDLAGVTFCDSAGLSALLRLWDDCTLAGGHMFIVNPARCVRRVFEMTGLDRILDERKAIRIGP